MTITLTLSDKEHDKLTRQAEASRFRSVQAWAKATLLEIADAQAEIRELAKRKEAARRPCK